MASPRLLHYSNTPVKSVYSCQQGPGARRYRRDKPDGLWVSVEGEDDWRWWCEAESFGNPAAQVCHEVVLAPTAKVLRLSTAAEVRAFTREYHIPGHRPYSDSDGIKWGHLSLEYAGIIIAPYQWDCRHDDRTNWYYGWDCASGCIWDATAIASITPQREHAHAR